MHSTGAEMVEGPMDDLGGSSSKAIQNGCGSSVRKRSRRDRVECEGETSSMRRRITRSYSAKQKEEREAATAAAAACSKEVLIERMQIEAKEMSIMCPHVAEGSAQRSRAAEEAALGADQNGGGLINNTKHSAEVISCEEFKVDEKRVSVLDVAGKQEEADVHCEGWIIGLDVEEGGALRKNILEDAAFVAGENGDCFINSINGSSKEITCEEIKVLAKRIIGLDVTGKQEELHTHDKKATEAAIFGVEQRTKSPEISNGSAMMEEATCAEEVRFVARNMVLSSVSEKGEEADSDEEESTGVVQSGADYSKNCFAVATRKTRKRRKGLKFEVGSRRVLRSDAAKKREEIDREQRQVFKEAAAGADHDRNSPAISNRNGTELMKCEEETNVDGERVMKIDLDKEREESGTDTKESVESRSGRKRSRDTSGANITRKKTKPDSSKCGQNRTRKIGAKQMKMDSMKHEDERTEIKTHQCSEPVVHATEERDIPFEKILQSKLKKASRMKAVKLKKDCSGSVASTRKESDIIEYKNVSMLGKGKNISMPRKGDTFRVLPSNKKGGGHERAHVKSEKEQSKKNLKPSTIAKHNMLKRFFLISECKVRENSSSQSLGENVSQAGRPSGKRISLKSKKDSEYLSPQIKAENVDFSDKKAQIIVKGGRSFTSKLTLKLKQKVKEENKDRRAAKEKLRDQIKSMLLSAGWKIDLRPRNGRNYKDSVYISPEGSGYWSITKAYGVFERQLKCAHDDRGNKTPRRSPKSCTGSNWNLEGTSSFSPIPMHVLSILKKTIVNKRRSKEELEEAKRKLKQVRKKLGSGSRHKKTKGNAKIKCSKSKHVEDKGGDLNSVIKENGNVDSSTKGGSGPSAQKSHLLPGRKRDKQRGCALLVRGANQETGTDTEIYVPYVWKRTIMSWMIDLGVVSANGKVKYMNKRRTRAMLEGMITRDGILCSCCNEILTIAKFESHAGSRVSQPYQNIYVEEAGASLHRCQLNAWEKQEESERRGFYSIDVDGDDPNDDTCGICGDGGDLICCDACPSTFHLSCLDIQILPSGNWHCTYCLCRFCGMVFDAAVQESGKNIPRLLSCYQCEEKYHQRCAPEADAISTNSDSSCISFCGHSCRKVFECLQSLLGVKNGMEEGFSWSLVQRIDEDSPKSFYGDDQKAECNSKIAVALGVMDECFLPIIDQRSGINLIHNVVYNCGSNFNRLDYRGFYTFILERGDEIISAACLRIHGTRLAEMPFIGTRNMYRRQGMCRRLLNEIESVLCSLNIEKLIIPAISELMETWTSVFGFQPLEISQKQEVKSMNVLVFPATGLLQKPLLRINSAELCEAASAVGIAEQDSGSHQTSVVAHEFPLLSPLETNDHTSDEVEVQRQDILKDVESPSRSSGGSVHSTAEVFSESFETAHGSEGQSPDDASLMKSDAEAPHLENVSHNGSVLKNNFDFSMEHGIKVPPKISVQDSHEPKHGDAKMPKS